MQITGKLIWTGNDSIDPSSKIYIELRDEDSLLIASTIIHDAKTFPISYTLKYKPSDIKLDHTYLLFARINESNDHLLFTNNAGTPVVFTDGKMPVIDIALYQGLWIYIPRDFNFDLLFSSNHSTPCKYGYEKKDDCEICECRDPCKLKNCGPEEKCVVDKKDDGEFWAHCESASVKQVKEQQPINADCMLPMRTGMCLAAFRNYYYNSETKLCEEFIYGGCDGNANNFETKEECEKHCKV